MDIENLRAEIAQMERMIAENVRLIAKGDDVEGRTYLKGYQRLRFVVRQLE